MKQHKADNIQPPIDKELSIIGSLLHSAPFALTVAEAQNKAHYEGIDEISKPLLDPEDDTIYVPISKKEQKIATNLAGFYALECGLNYLATTQHKRPSDILRAIVADTIDPSDRALFCHFANATWKASQPFLGLNRITRDVFTPFNFLTEADVKKDWIQIKTAAGLMLREL